MNAKSEACEAQPNCKLAFFPHVHDKTSQVAKSRTSTFLYATGRSPARHFDVLLCSFDLLGSRNVQDAGENLLTKWQTLMVYPFYSGKLMQVHPTSV